MTFSNALAQSSNVGIIKTALSLGRNVSTSISDHLGLAKKLKSICQENLPVFYEAPRNGVPGH